MDIRSEHRYRFAAPPERVWEVIASVDRYRSWWPWLRRFEAHKLAEHDTWQCTVKPPLPYTLRCTVELVEVRAPTLVVARLTGDIAGLSHLRLFPFAAGPPGAPPPPQGPVGGQEAPGDDRDPAGGRTRGGNGARDQGPASRNRGAAVTRARPGVMATTATEVRIDSSLTARSGPVRLAARLFPAVARWGHDQVFDIAARQFAAAQEWDGTTPDGPCIITPGGDGTGPRRPATGRFSGPRR